MERYSNIAVSIVSKPRNLITHYDDTLLAMAELEGEGWLDHQLHTAPDREYDVPRAVAQVTRRQQDAKDWTPDPEYPNDKPPDLRDTVGDAIYGSGGWHRYFVRGTGDVIFSGMHASPENRKKAKELGFEVW